MPGSVPPSPMTPGRQSSEKGQRGPSIGSVDSAVGEREPRNKYKKGKSKKLKKVSSDALLAELEKLKGENPVTDTILENIM